MPEINQEERKTTKADKFANLIFHLEKWLEDDFDGEFYEKNKERWEQISRNYKGDLPSNQAEDFFPYKGAPNTNLLISEFFIDGIAVRLKNFLMGEIFKADLRTTDAKSRDKIEITEKFINAVFQHVLRIQKHIYKYCHLASKKTVILRRDWVIKESNKQVVVEPKITTPSPEQMEKVTREVMDEGTVTSEEELLLEVEKRLIPAPTKETKLVKDEFAKLSIVPNIDFVVPDDATGLEDASRKTHRMFLTIDDMEARNFDGIDKIKKHVENKKKDEAKTPEEKAMIESGNITFGQEKVTIFEVTTEFEIEGDKQQWIIYYHKDSKTIAKTLKYDDMYGDTSTQFTQIFFKDDDTFWKRSVGDITSHTQQIGNDIMNTALQMVAYTLQGILFYSEDAFEGDEEVADSIKIHPGAFNKVKDPSQIVFKEFPGQPMIAPEIIDSFFVLLLQRVTGQSATQFAQPTKQDKTLGEVSIIRAEGNLIHRAFFSGPGAEWEELIEGILALYQLHMAPDTFNDLVDGEGKHIFPEGITRDQIQGNFKAAVRGSKGLLSQQEEVATAQALIALSDPGEIQGMVNTRENIKKLMDLSSIDPEEALLEIEEIFAEKVRVQKQALVEATPQILEELAKKQAEQQETTQTVKEENGQTTEVVTEITQQGNGQLSQELNNLLGSVGQ